MVWETILSEFPDVDGKTVLAAIALPPSLLTTYNGTAQHNYSHWTRVALPEGRPDMEQLEGIPGVLPSKCTHKLPFV